MNKLRVDISDVLLQGCTRQHGQTGLPRLRQAVHLQKISVSPRYEYYPHSCTILNFFVISFSLKLPVGHCMAFIGIYVTVIWLHLFNCDMVTLNYMSTG